MTSAISNTTTVNAGVTVDGSRAAVGGTSLVVDGKQINSFMAGANNVDPKTMGFGMTFMHEILHTAVGISKSDPSGDLGSDSYPSKSDERFPGRRFKVGHE